MHDLQRLISKIPSNRIIFTGIWTLPFTFVCIASVMRSWGGDLTVIGYLLAALYALLGCVVITGIHVYQYVAWGKRTFTLRSALHNRDLPSRRKLDASHPAVPEKYLSPSPSGYILGRMGQKYVRILPSEDSFCALICSSPGSGKSVTMMASLLGNFCSPHRSFLTIATDPKDELSSKFADLPDVRVISLTDRAKYGYNPFYWYKSEISDEDMEPYLKTMAEALVSDSGGERNMYFWANARKILIGLMTWLIRKGKNFPETMTAINTHDVTSLIEQALDESDSKLVRKMLSSFSGKTGEDMQSIQTEVTTSIDIFAASSAMDWALAESPRMASPYDIEYGNSLFLSIEQERITEYAAFIRLFYAQLFQYLIKQREDSFTNPQLPIWILLEEAPLYGAIPHLDSFLSTCRSKKISVYVICQSISQLEGTYGKERANTIIDDCLVKVVLGVANSETAEFFSKITGQYEEEKSGTQSKGLFKIPSSYSYNSERRRCMDPEEFFNLKSGDSVVLFIDGSFMQVKKVKYYEDYQLSSLMRHREIAIEAAQKRKDEVKINDEPL